MAKFCLTPQQVQQFKKALKNREFKPDEYANLENSGARREYINKFVGEDNARQVNALYEKGLGLKNQRAGFITATKKVLGLKTLAGRDMISKIKRLQSFLNPVDEKSFYEDMVSQRLGLGISETEAKVISELSAELTVATAKKDPSITEFNVWKTKQDGIDYGSKRQALEKYVGQLKAQSKPSDFVRPTSLEAIGQDIKATVKLIAQNTRALVASFDNSLWGNQGVRAALDPRYTGLWAKNFAKSFRDIAKTLVKGKDAGDEILDATKAEVYSRKYANQYEMGTKETSKLDLGGIEEEFPTSLPSKIPVLGRFFKAAEVAYEAGAIRLRADIADKMYAMAERQGINMADKFEIGSRNVVVNSITGRGRIKVPNIVNDAAFSVKFTKSQLDFLTVNAFDKLSPSARKEAGKNILRVVASTAVILGISKALDDDSTDFDSRSTRFGKIEKNGFTLINLTPGYGSMITLISSILSQSTKNRAGIVKKLGEGYGVPNGMDIFWDFTENKASPIASIIRDLVRQETFEGDKPTPTIILKNAITSISLESSQEILADQSGDSLLKAIAIGLGILGTGAGSTYYPDKWENRTTKEMTKFKKRFGDAQLKHASGVFNNKYQSWLQKRVKDPKYQKLSDEDKQKDLTKKKKEIKEQVFRKYGFK